MWSWNEILIFFFVREQRDIIFASYEYRNSRRRAEGHNLCLFGMSTTYRKTFPQRPRKCCWLETLLKVCWWCLLRFTCYLTQKVSLQNMVLCDLKPNICVYYMCTGISLLWMRQFRMIVASLLLSFKWGGVVKKAKNWMFVLRLEMSHDDIRPNCPLPHFF